MAEATCERCGESFKRRTIRHRFCSKDCQQRAAGRRRDRSIRVEPGPCSINGCDMPRRSMTAAWCEMHYGRWRRNGDPEALQPSKLQYATDRGYIKLKLPDHPLADRQGYVYEHRAVAYEVHGPGPTQCHWCGVALEWDSDLHVDHLDHSRGNNNPANLVPSCRPCNTIRKEADTEGKWALIMAERRVLAQCADEVEAIRLALLKARDQPGGWNA